MLNKISKIIREKNVLSLATNLSASALGMLSLLLLTRGLIPEEFSSWALYLTWATFFDMLRFGLTNTALIRFSAGCNDDDKHAYLASSYKIGLSAVIIITVLLWGSLIAIKTFNISIPQGWYLIFKWYPILAFVNLSWNNAISNFQAQQKFSSILAIRLSYLTPFVLFLGVNTFFLHWGLSEVIIAHLIANTIPSIVSIYKKWDGLSYLKRSTEEKLKELLAFGKYSMGTFIGSNLLQSADIFIIGLSTAMGQESIALYYIPLKLTEYLGIPLRSFSITAFPKMSQQSREGNLNQLKKIFYGYSGAVTYLFFPLSLLGFIFAEELVWFMGGDQYIDSLPQLATIFRIFSVYSLILPLDRFTGVALDSINRPKYNFQKVIIMTTMNIIGNIIAVFVYGSLEVVALVTVLFTLAGIIFGYSYLNKEISVNIKYVFSEGYSFFKNIKSHI